MNTEDVMKYGNLTLHTALGRVPRSQWEREGVCGVWSVKAIVSHLASYELLLCEVLGGIVRDDPTPLLAQFVEIGPAAFNDVEVAKRATVTAEAAVAEYDRAHQQVMALLGSVPPALLREPGTLPWYGLEYSLDDLIVYLYYGHKREHSAQVEVFADQLAGEEQVRHFNDLLNQRNVDGMMTLMTESCLFENTTPAPDGARYQNQEEVRDFWRAFFDSSPQTTIEIEELFGAGRRCVMRWRYRWVDGDGFTGHVRGVDIYTVENGLIAEKLSYVKG